MNNKPSFEERHPHLTNFFSIGISTLDIFTELLELILTIIEFIIELVSDS